MHQEAIGESCNPAKTGGIAPNAGSVFVPFAVDAGTDFQKVPARSADIRLLRCAFLTSAGSRINKASAGRQTNKEDRKQCSNKKQAHGTLQSVARFYV